MCSIHSTRRRPAACGGGDFNFDFGVSAPKEQVLEPKGAQGLLLADVSRRVGPALGSQLIDDRRGASLQHGRDRVVYHTYSTYARGVEIMMGFYPLLDRAPKGRNESADSDFWIRRHDEY